MNTKLSPYIDKTENRQTLFNFYEDVYPDSPWLLDSERFYWQTISNPLQTPKEYPIWLLQDENNQLIGQNIYIFYNLSIDNKKYRGFCSTNLIVKPGIVGKGFGHKLIGKNESFDGVAYAVGITHASTRAFLKRGWVLVEDALLMNKIINPVPNLKYLKMPMWKILILAPIIKLAGSFFDVLSLFRAKSTFKDVTYREISSFEPEWDSYWENYLSDYAINFKRSYFHLNYKYKSRKDVQHTVYLFEKENIPVGYAVFRLSENKIRNLKLGRIVDFVYDPSLGNNFVNYIINLLKKELQKQSVDAIVGIAANKNINKAYKDNGFFLSRKQAAIIKEEDFKISELRKKYQNLWYITLGDSDLDNYW